MLLGFFLCLSSSEALPTGKTDTTPKIECDHNLTKIITDQDIELLDQKVCLFNTLETFTKPALECEDGLHVMMCSHPFVLFEREVMERGYFSDFSDFPGSIPSKLLSSPTKILKNFTCDPIMTESIVDNCGTDCGTRELKKFCVFSTAEYISDGISCEDGLYILMCRQPFARIEKRARHFGWNSAHLKSSIPYSGIPSTSPKPDPDPNNAMVFKMPISLIAFIFTTQLYFLHA